MALADDPADDEATAGNGKSGDWLVRIFVDRSTLYQLLHMLHSL